MRSMLWIGGGLLALAVSTTVARANLITNAGLELNPTVFPTNGIPFVICTPTSNANALPGWTITSGSIDVVPNTYWQNTEGSYSVDLVGTPGIGSIRQLVSGTVPGTDYTLSFDFSPNPETWDIDESVTTKILLVQAYNSTGTTLIAQQPYFLTNGSRTTTAMQFTQQTFDFTATGPTLLVLSAVTPANLPSSESSSFVFMGPVIDNLDLSISVGDPPLGGEVPEPASLCVLGLGSLMLMRRRR